MKQLLQIAIDGPVASGKGDIAARLAHRLNLLYINTGAMYRALALACFQHKVSLKDEKQVVALLTKTNINLIQTNPKNINSCNVFLDGQDVTDKIFTQKVANATSVISAYADVRKILVQRQKQMAKNQRVVMEGRDIGLRVLPTAQIKVFLTATLEERAKRRFKQMQKKGSTISYEQVIKDTRDRDRLDSTRSADPLQKFSDAWELDTTKMDQPEVVNAILHELKKRNLI